MFTDVDHITRDKWQISRVMHCSNATYEQTQMFCNFSCIIKDMYVTVLLVQLGSSHQVDSSNQ